MWHSHFWDNDNGTITKMFKLGCAQELTKLLCPSNGQLKCDSSSPNLFSGVWFQAWTCSGLDVQIQYYTLHVQKADRIHHDIMFPSFPVLNHWIPKEDRSHPYDFNLSDLPISTPTYNDSVLSNVLALTNLSSGIGLLFSSGSGMVTERERWSRLKEGERRRGETDFTRVAH